MTILNATEGFHSAARARFDWPGVDCGTAAGSSRLHAAFLGVAPALNCPGALGRVKGPLAALAAGAPLTRPARSQVFGNYRSVG